MTTPGSLVEFFQDRKVLCGLCLKTDKRGAHVLSEENREIGVPESRILLTIPNWSSPDGLREQVVERLKSASLAREQFRQGIVLADLWELLQDDRRKYAAEELADTYFGTEPGPEKTSAMLRALRDDRIWFERKGEQYVPSDPDHVQQVQQSIRAEAEKESERNDVVRWFSQLWLGMPAAPPACSDKYVRWLKDCVLQGPEAARFKEMIELLKRAGIHQNDSPFQILVKTGVWDVDEDVLLHKHQIALEFPAAVLEEADACLAAFRAGDDWRAGREDLRHLYAYTIDDEYTTEMDDALSYERLADGQHRVGIHIADAAHFVVPGTAIDKEALHRATSLYFADRKVRMLPPPLSDVICSLQQGEDRPALSILVTLDDAAQVLESRIAPSLVHVRERLTYRQVNLNHAEVPPLDALLRLARTLKANRMTAGAIHIPFPKIEVRVVEDKQVVIQREDADTPGQTMVSEFMILANRMVGQLCVDNDLPAVYRSQDPPSEPLDIPTEFGPLDAFRIRRFLKKGDQGIKPVRHHGLGLDAYVQFTSPIRRYIDLAMHRQVKSYLSSGDVLMTESDMADMLTVCSGPIELAETMERQRRTYWIMRSLENDLWQTRDAVVLQVFHDRYFVQLQDCLLFADCQPRTSGKHPTPGETIQVRIEMVWPREGVVRLTEEHID
ncbi:MAG TPA: ribonuclease R family protein [Candidatus Xenobia bacterium]|jgi:exoribonuclease-2